MEQAPEGAVVEPTARFEQLRIPLREPVHGLDSVPATLGRPRGGRRARASGS